MTLTALKVMSKATRLDKKFKPNYTAKHDYTQVPSSQKTKLDVIS